MQWQLPPTPDVPQWFIEAVKPYCPLSEGTFAAQLLWQRGIQTPEELIPFLDADAYTPMSPFAFGEEMEWAVKRLQTAREAGEKVAIWGDFDADGITSTSVLWDGLGAFFRQGDSLCYYIPNRLTESHGLNEGGIEGLASQGVSLIVTCDTGSTNLREIEVAKQWGIEVIVTDHHTLPPQRPGVVAIINPRYFSETHPLYHLSGVAVAYKLVEALYTTLPDVPEKPLTELLDLVAIGLIADLVELRGDCRYLAQRGIQQLQTQLKNPTRPGVAKLLSFCRGNGDRPTDISFGLGPRINAVSRIHGDATFCVELLTSRDEKRCQQLAEETELANTRRKELQKNVTQAVKQKLAQVDLSTTNIIVLEDPQWSAGVLGLVAGQIAQEYGKPVILLSTGEDQSEFAKGSARSINGIDLYQLIYSQQHLLDKFGGHPYAAGLKIAVENLPAFIEGLNQELRLQFPETGLLRPVVHADIKVTVADLGKALFKELTLLEPCGMGNPVPQLLIENCWFTNLKNKNIVDKNKRKVKYIRTFFEVIDETVSQGFPGIWWGHYQDELPENEPCDAVVELDANPYEKRYEVRLMAVRLRGTQETYSTGLSLQDYILDWRGNFQPQAELEQSPILLKDCPSQWDKVHQKFRQAVSQTRPLALAYPSPDQGTPQEVLMQLVGVFKYLHRTQEKAKLKTLQEKLQLSPASLKVGVDVLIQLGFKVRLSKDSLQVLDFSKRSSLTPELMQPFLDIVSEEQFKRHYFYEVPVESLSSQLVMGNG
ncbi:single-stranded-DNA-specific exonuclease RecJ [Spirulina sp. CS-785/01]|uniref:single-stranded-DNA-specific exonuclease RecJ n=1 Tax=Spirulina sp. CS-785/01 TaxID=3021716 RepID=UPI00232BC8B7|nr:single-stranded-DNA-specific exonuclease RecJ [Spirulina sp. CS-785/01]MDB9311715.1 single-stranded-DNA-specific exonuclease RecJ [Spirulina sp. CS-785/01]